LSYPTGGNVYGVAIGTRPENVEIPQVLKRDPGPGDNIYPIGKKWINTTANTTFTLTSFSSMQGSLLANWEQEGGGATTSPISQFTVGDSPDQVTVLPDAMSNVNLPDGNGIAAVGTANTVTYNMASPFTGDFTFDGNISSSQSNATPANGSSLNLLRSRGSTGTPVIVDSGDVIGNIQFSGYDGAAYQLAGTIQTTVAGAPGAASMPGSMSFQVTDTGSGTPTKMMQINYNDSSASPNSNEGFQIFEPLVVNPPGNSFNPDTTHLCMLTVNAQDPGEAVAILIRNNVGSPPTSSNTSLLFGSSSPTSPPDTQLYCELACMPIDNTNSQLLVNILSGGTMATGASFNSDKSLAVNGTLILATVGTSIQVSTGTNAKAGQAVLVAGTVTVDTTAVQTSSFIFLTRAVGAGTAAGIPQVGSISDASKFIIDSVDATGAIVTGDTSTINWWIIDSI